MTKLSPSEQDAIIQLLTRIYMDIAAIETEYQLMAGDGDFRPRIEYFHDAVRECSAQNPAHRKTSARLSVELLAYDVACLRYLQEKPLASIKSNADVLSPKTDMVAVDRKPLVSAIRPDRAVRDRLSELYQHYAVLFAALLKPAADLDYHERTDTLNQDVEEISTIVAELDKLAKGKGSAEALAAAVQNLEDDGLRQALVAFIKKQKFKNRDDIKKALMLLKDEIKKNDKRIAAIEQQLMKYALAQLAVYEEAKPLLKQMASKGMNLVGKFVESAMAETKREMGR